MQFMNVEHIIIEAEAIVMVDAEVRVQGVHDYLLCSLVKALAIAGAFYFWERENEIRD